MLWGVPRRPLKLFGFGSGRGGWPQVKGERLLRLTAFRSLWLRVLGQWWRGWSVLF